MRVLGKEEFLESKDKKPIWVPLPEDLYGNDSGFYVRVMSGWERSEIEKLYINGDPSTDPGGFRGRILVNTIVDEDGIPIFQTDDIKQLMDKNAGTIEILFEKSCELNGLTKKDVERLEKN